MGRSERRKRQWWPSSEQMIVWAPGSFILVSGIILAMVLWALRNEAIQSGERLTRAFARHSEDQATRTIQSVDQTLQLALAKLAGRDGNLTPAAAESLESVFVGYLEDRPFIRALFVLDAAGRVAIDTDSAMVGRDMSDRTYFQHHQTYPFGGFQVNLPVVSRHLGTRVIIASRPWRSRPDTFSGIVAAVIEPEYFGRTLVPEEAAVERTVSLMRRDGIMLMRSPHHEEVIGQSFAGSPLFKQLREYPNGSMRGMSPVDDEERQVSYRTLSAYPTLVIVVSQSMQRILGPWTLSMAAAATMWFVASVVLLAMSFWLRTEWHRRSRAEADLRLSSGRLSAVMDYTVDGLIVINEEGAVLSFSKPAEGIFGYSSGEVVGRNVNMLMPEPYHSAHDGYLAAYLETGNARIIGIGREVHGLHKDGTVFPMDLAVGEIPTESGARQFVGTVRDISQRKATEEQLHQAQKMEAVGQLTGGIAHDFNNLLAVMTGNVEMAREANLDDDTAAMLETAQRAGQRGAELTRRLLAFSRRQTLLPKNIDVNQLVRDMVMLLERTLGETIRVETVLEGSEPLYAVVDPGQLENALLNLAVNARDAMPNGGMLSITTRSVDLDEGYASSHAEVAAGFYRVISVSDCGTGMPEDVRAKAFEPFFTTKQAGKGSGLGLSMVYGFLKQSGGHVSIYSEVGHGTTVQMYLPVAGETLDSLGPVESADTAGIGQGQTILIVEDDDDVRSVVASMTTRLGFVPVLTSDGHEALEILSENEGFDLMITDVVMPRGMSGVELATAARERWPQMPVVFISGYSSETEALAEVVRQGGALLTKPFSRAELAHTIWTAQQRKRGGVE